MQFADLSHHSNDQSIWRVLLVDDDEDDYVLFLDMLHSAQEGRFQLERASTFEAGRNAIRTGKFDAILVNYDLGAHSGIDLIREVASRKYPAPILLLSGRGHPEADIEALRSGAADYLYKDDLNSRFLERSIRYAIERRRVEEDLRLSEARFNKAFNATPDALVISRQVDGLIQEVNNAFINLFGYSRSEVVGKTSLDLNMFEHPADREKAIKRLQADQSVRNFELGIRTKTGEIRQASLSIEILSIDDEIHILTIIQDTTERKQAEAELFTAHEQAAWLARFPNENPNPVVRVAAEGIVLYHNSAAATLPGWVLQVGQPVPGLLLPAIRNSMELGKWVQEEIPIGERYYSITFMPFPGEGYVNLYASDITDRKQAEETLINQAKLLDLVHDAIFAMDGQMRITFWNQSAERLYGWSKEEALGKNAAQLIRSEVTEDVRQRLLKQSHEIGSYQGEVIHHSKDGRRLVIEASMSVQKDASGRVVGYLTANRDMTDRKLAEEALRASEEKFARAFQYNPAGMSITRAADARYMDANQSFCNLIGYSREELLGHTSVELGLYSDETPGVSAMRHLRDTSSIRQLEFPITTRNGSQHTLLLSLDPIEVAGEACNLVTFIDITERKKMLEAQTQIQLHHRLMEQRELDRQALARDLHDGPVQNLSGLLFNIQFAKEAISDLATQVELENIGLGLKNTVQELRNIINELRPPSLIRFGLAKAMNVFLEEFRENHPEVELDSSLADDGCSLSEQVRLSLYRILQEALTNVVRHSSAKRVAVTLICEEHQTILEIQDDGKGFAASDNLADFGTKGHFGLVGMKERAEAIGAILEINTLPEKGTTIRVIVPLA